VSKPCTPVVHIKIAGKWMFIPLKMVLIGIDPYPFHPIKNRRSESVRISMEATNQIGLTPPLDSWELMLRDQCPMKMTIYWYSLFSDTPKIIVLAIHKYRYR
jgi:hypothetical protein